jgi:hypothetical protein
MQNANYLIDNRYVATTATKVRWQGRRNDEIVGVINRLRPLWVQRKGWTTPNSSSVAARLLPAEAFASGKPCDPLTNSRSAHARSE